MKRVWRFLLSYAVSFASLFLIGYGWLMSAMENASRMVWLFLGSSLLLAVIFTLIWELFLCEREQTRELTVRVNELETEVKGLKKQDQSEPHDIEKSKN